MDNPNQPSAEQTATTPPDILLRPIPRQSGRFNHPKKPQRRCSFFNPTEKSRIDGSNQSFYTGINSSSENPLPESQNAGKTTKIKFSESVDVLLIPHINDYKAANLCEEIWHSRCPFGKPS